MVTMSPDRKEWVLEEWRGRRKRKWELIQRKKVERRQPLQQTPRLVQTRSQKRRLEGVSRSPAPARQEHGAATNGAGPSRPGPHRQQQQPPRQQQSRAKRQNLGVSVREAQQGNEREVEGQKQEEEERQEQEEEKEEEEQEEQAEEQEEEEEAEQQACVQELVQTMQYADKDALMQQLCQDPRAAHQSFERLLNNHAPVLQQVSRLCLTPPTLPCHKCMQHLGGYAEMGDT
eukprot:1150313-Pelagomonas_calceolata.AAC.7